MAGRGGLMSLLFAALLDALAAGVEGTLAACLFGHFFAGLLVYLVGDGR